MAPRDRSTNILRAALLLFGALLLLPGCEAMRPLLGQMLATAPKPTARVSNATIDKLSADSVTLLLDVDVTNPYSLPMPLSNVAYGVGAGEDRAQSVVSGELIEPGIIPANGSKTLQLPLTISLPEVLQAARGVKLGSVVPYAARLELSANNPLGGEPITLPLSHEGEMPVPAPPKVEVAGIDWKNVGLSETAGTLRLRVTNANQFVASLRELGYTFKLNNIAVASGAVEDSLELAPNNPQEVAIPFTLRGGELGRAALGALTGGQLDYSVDGAVDLGTPFGNYREQFAQSGKTALR